MTIEKHLKIFGVHNHNEPELEQLERSSEWRCQGWSTDYGVLSANGVYEWLYSVFG